MIKKNNCNSKNYFYVNFFDKYVSLSIMYSLVLWGKRGKTSSVVNSRDVKVKNRVTKAKWGSSWLPAKIIIKSGNNKYSL